MRMGSFVVDDHLQTSVLLPSRERPVLLRPLDDGVEVLSQQVTPSNQIHRRTSNSLKVVIDASISLFEGQARITLGCRAALVGANGMYDPTSW